MIYIAKIGTDEFYEKVVNNTIKDTLKEALEKCRKYNMRILEFKNRQG